MEFQSRKEAGVAAQGGKGRKPLASKSVVNSKERESV